MQRGRARLRPQGGGRRGARQRGPPGRDGRTYLQPELGARLAADPDGRARRPLRPRGRVLRLIALGHTNAEIAEQLLLSVRTVESHRAHIQRKLRYEQALGAGPLRARAPDARFRARVTRRAGRQGGDAARDRGQRQDRPAKQDRPEKRPERKHAGRNAVTTCDRRTRRGDGQGCCQAGAKGQGESGKSPSGTTRRARPPPRSRSGRTENKPELVETIPITTSPGAARRVALSLGPDSDTASPLPDIAGGDRLEALAELELTTDAPEPNHPGLIGNAYSYAPNVEATLLLAADATVTEAGSQAIALAAPWRQAISHERHHGVVTFGDGAIAVPAGGLPWGTGARINLVVGASHPEAKAGDVLLVGQNEKTPVVVQDMAGIRAVRYRPGNAAKPAPHAPDLVPVRGDPGLEGPHRRPLSGADRPGRGRAPADQGAARHRRVGTAGAGADLDATVHRRLAGPGRARRRRAVGGHLEGQPLEVHGLQLPAGGGPDRVGEIWRREGQERTRGTALREPRRGFGSALWRDRGKPGLANRSRAELLGSDAPRRRRASLRASRRSRGAPAPAPRARVRPSG